MLPRRKFACSLLALGAVKLVPGFAVRPDAPPPEGEGAKGLRQPPERPVTLRSGLLTVTLDGKDGLPFRYLLNGHTIWGEDVGAPITAILCRLQPRSYVTASLSVASVARTLRSAAFHFQVPFEQEIGAEFVLHYAIAGASLTVTLESVAERPGFELIEVALPSLATVRETGEGAWMAQGRSGGSFVRVAEAKPYRYKDDENFGRTSTQLPIGVLGTRHVGCLMEVTGFMDGTETSIATIPGGRSAHIGTVLVHRVHGGRCYNMNNGGDPVCGTQQTPNLLVEQASPCRFDFFRVDDADIPWFPAAKLLRTRMPAIPTRYFDDKLLYLIAGKQKTESGPRTTFAQSRTLIRDIARLTDYAPQVAYISGWVYDGQDTGYPSEDKVNASLGSYEELMQLMADSRRINANVSVNVNYDDAYKSSPEFDPAFIAREPDGAIWKSRAWDGEDSYIVGMAKYVLGGWATRRIAATMARYKLRDAILIDAMSWFAVRNDWDPGHPAGGYKNLVDGKWRVIDEFRKRGVSVASEQFRYPMLGKLALSVNGPEPRPCPFGGQQIPLTAIVYRKAAIFGSSGDGVLRPQQDLFWNSRPGLWFENKTDRAAITDFYYLLALPFNKVHRLQVESYANHGSLRELRLEGQSRIAMDAAGTSYEVAWQGATIARDESTCCPVDANRIAFYSRGGGRLSYPLPPAWTGAKVTARALTVDGRTASPVSIEAGQIVVEPPARVPVMVYASDDAIPAPEVAPKTPTASSSLALAWSSDRVAPTHTPAPQQLCRQGYSLFSEPREDDPRMPNNLAGMLRPGLSGVPLIVLLLCWSACTYTAQAQSTATAPSVNLPAESIDRQWVDASKKYDAARNQILLRVDQAGGEGPFTPDWKSLANYSAPDWYRDAKFGIFIHWGVYSVPAFFSEWYPREMYIEGSAANKHQVATYGPLTEFGYKDFIPMFKAEQFDPEAWARLFADAGAKYVVPVFEHHDGFTMYDSSLSDWTAVKMGPKRDLAGDLARAVRAEGLHLGASSHRVEHDWFFDGGRKTASDVNDPRNAAFYGPAHERLNKGNDDLIEDWTYTSPAFLNDWLARSAEIVEKYHPDIMYFDWWIGQPSVRPYLARFAAFYYDESRKHGTPGVIDYKFDAMQENSGTLDIERGQLEATRSLPWQTDSSVSNHSWGYVEHDVFKTPEFIIHQLVDIVSKNGNLLMNIGPRADGTIPDEVKQVLLGVGAWLKVNGEAIYGTRPWKIFGEGPTKVAGGSFNDVRTSHYTAQDFRFTSKGGVLYAIELAWPVDRVAVIHALGFDELGVPARVQSVRLLGSSDAVAFEQKPDGLYLRLPKQVPTPDASSYRIEFEPSASGTK